VSLCQQPRLKHSETFLHTRLDVHRAQQAIFRAPQRHLRGTVGEKLKPVLFMGGTIGIVGVGAHCTKGGGWMEVWTAVVPSACGARSARACSHNSIHSLQAIER
jgi:hypothetical protein